MSGNPVADFFMLDDTVLLCGAFWLFCAVVTAFLAANRGKNSFKWFALGLLLGPLAFALAVWSSFAVKGRRDETAKEP